MSWPFPRRPHVGHVARERVDDRLGAAVIGFVAAHHHGQHAILGSSLPAGDRRVEEAHTAFLGCGIDFAGDNGGIGGVVDENRAFRHAGERAVLAIDDRTQIVVGANAGEDHLRALGGGGRGRSGAAPVDLGPLRGLGLGPVVDGDLMARLREMPRHPEPHHAEPEKRHLGAAITHPCVLPAGFLRRGAAS